MKMEMRQDLFDDLLRALGEHVLRERRVTAKLRKVREMIDTNRFGREAMAGALDEILRDDEATS